MNGKIIDALDVTGTLTFAPVDPPRPLARYVIQRTAAGKGNVTGDKAGRLQIRLHVRGANPRTQIQQAQRGLLARGVSAWRALTTEQKKAWSETGSREGLPAYHSFLRAFIRQNTPQPFTLWATTWDAGATTWDAGATTWRTRWDDGATNWQ